jgi:hypothetical protein
MVEGRHNNDDDDNEDDHEDEDDIYAYENNTMMIVEWRVQYTASNDIIIFKLFLLSIKHSNDDY